MLVRITIFMVIVTIIWRCLIRLYLKGDFKESIKLSFDKDYAPWYICIFGILMYADIALILASAFYLLFLR